MGLNKIKSKNKRTKNGHYKQPTGFTPQVESWLHMLSEGALIKKLNHAQKQA